MGMITINSRDFNQDVGGAKRAAKDGPVIITDRGHESHVLLSIEEYRRLTGKRMSLAESLAQTGPDSDFDWQPPKLTGRFTKLVELD